MEIKHEKVVKRSELRPMDVIMFRDGNDDFEYRMVVQSSESKYYAVNLDHGSIANNECSLEGLLNFYVSSFDEVIVIPHEKIKMELGGVLR
jgi:hypothetical protein